MPKKKTSTKRKKKEQVIQLLPYDWGVVQEAIRKMIDDKRERHKNGARRLGDEQRFHGEMEYLADLHRKIVDLANTHPYPKFPVKFPRF